MTTVDNHKKLSDAQVVSSEMFDILRELVTDTWLRPMDLGGRSNSNHSRILSKLVDLGLAEKMTRSAHGSRPSYVYRLLPEGVACIDRINTNPAA